MISIDEIIPIPWEKVLKMESQIGESGIRIPKCGQWMAVVPSSASNISKKEILIGIRWSGPIRKESAWKIIRRITYGFGRRFALWDLNEPGFLLE